VKKRLLSVQKTEVFAGGPCGAGSPGPLEEGGGLPPLSPGLYAGAAESTCQLPWRWLAVDDLKSKNYGSDQVKYMYTKHSNGRRLESDRSW
jgi:hypothetical protein